MFATGLAFYGKAQTKPRNSIGLTPGWQTAHIRIKNTKAEVDGGHDKVLQKALELLR